MARTNKSFVERKKKRDRRRERKTRNKRFTKKRSNVAVFGHVYSDGCHFCQDMQPEWDKIVQRAPFTMNDIGDDHDAKIKLINNQYNTNLVANGFPTIFRIIEVKGKKYSVDYYNGSRTADLIMKWLVQPKKQ